MVYSVGIPPSKGDEVGKLIIALDGKTPKEAKEFISSLPQEDRDYFTFKFNDLLGMVGIEGVGEITKEQQVQVMLDGKWHDVGNTLGNYLTQLAKNEDLAKRTKYLTIHASNGIEGIKTAIEKKKKLGLGNTKILAITALTNLNDSDTQRIFGDTAKHTVLKLTKLALEAGADGVVCSAQEAEMLRAVFGDGFDIVTPGIRFAGSDKGDQKRVTTPAEAIKAGTKGIVMGTEIVKKTVEETQAAIERLRKEVEGVVPNIDYSKYTFERLLYTGEWLDLLKYIGAFYQRPEGGEYCRLTSELISNCYLNMGVSERSSLVLERGANELAGKLQEMGIKADVVVGAQMGSVRLSSYLAKSMGLVGLDESIYSEKDNPFKTAIQTIKGICGESKDYIKEILSKSVRGAAEFTFGKFKEVFEITENVPKEDMTLLRHDIDFKGKKIVLSEDIITKGSTIEKMIKKVEAAGGEVVAITCIGNRYGKDNFNGIPLISCFTPPEFEMYYDDKTPKKNRGNHPKLPEDSKVSEKPKNEWPKLVESMRKAMQKVK